MNLIYYLMNLKKTSLFRKNGGNINLVPLNSYKRIHILNKFFKVWYHKHVWKRWNNEKDLCYLPSLEGKIETF